MPANIAHILIANAAYDELRKLDQDVADQVLAKNNLFYLGSLGPDLPSYKTSELVEAALRQLLVRPFIDNTNPQEEDASFFLHSTRPNLFPYYLMETNTSFMEIKNKKLEVEEFNIAVFAFTMGYVCHIASDQIIHRFVREIVGPYYRSLETSQKHSECEVHQDLYLFYEKKPNSVFSKTVVSELVNINKLGFDYEMFCNMISLAVSKAGYKKVSKEDIDGWFDGIKLAFKLMDDVGPYVSVLKEYENQKKNLKEYPFYKRYFRNEATGLDYIRYYDKAVELSVKYMKEIADLWKKPEFSFDRLVEYQKVIQPEDLTSPLREDLL